MNERLLALASSLDAEKLDALVVSSAANRFYLTAFSGSEGILLAGLCQAYLFVDSRYEEQAAAEAPGLEVRQVKEGFIDALARLINEQGMKRVGFEARAASYSVHAEMKEKIGVELVPVFDVVEKMRALKSDHELALLKEGAAELDRAFSHLLGFARPGMTENDVALEIEFFLRRRGAEKASFRYIVASGKRGAMPHGVASDKRLEQGELVTVDFGAVFNQYATDMTRTFALGSVTKRQQEIYNLVLEARNRAVGGIAPLMAAVEADALARDVINDGGYGEYFGHGLGHGLGLETHELPRLGTRSKDTLKAGMVLTIEPGIYIPGWGGVRIEDMAEVTAGGLEIMTRSPLELQII